MTVPVTRSRLHGKETETAIARTERQEKRLRLSAALPREGAGPYERPAAGRGASPGCPSETRRLTPARGGEARARPPRRFRILPRRPLSARARAGAAQLPSRESWAPPSAEGGAAPLPARGRGRWKAGTRGCVLQPRRRTAFKIRLFAFFLCCFGACRGGAVRRSGGERCFQSGAAGGAGRCLVPRGCLQPRPALSPGPGPPFRKEGAEELAAAAAGTAAGPEGLG